MTLIQTIVNSDNSKIRNKKNNSYDVKDIIFAFIYREQIHLLVYPKMLTRASTSMSACTFVII